MPSSQEPLRPLSVWLDPDHLVSTAKIVLDGHGIRRIGVLDLGRLVGTVSRDTLRFARDDDRVRPYVDPNLVRFDADTPVRQIAEAFVSGDLDCAALMDDERFMGLIAATDLLRELRRSWDPLTGLSWSDQLREWGVSQLRGGREISVIFIDLDDFGLVNKRFGHVVGDRALLAIANYLKKKINAETDILVRYGGDEFAIGTLRPFAETEQFVSSILGESRSLEVDGADHPIGFSVGSFGGRRTREREKVHAVAMLDDLINNASRACTVDKHRRNRVEDKREALLPAQAVVELSAPTPHPTPAPAPAPVLASPNVSVVGIHAGDEGPLNQVLLKVNGETVVGVHAALGRPIEWSIAIATARALERSLPNRSLEISSVKLEAQTVVIEGLLTENDHRIQSSGRASVGEDLGMGVALAVIQAFNAAVDSPTV